MTRFAASAVLVLVFAFVAWAGYRLLCAGLEVDVYRERLVELERDFEELRDHYNQAVRKTAVTELVVEDGKVRVSIQTAAGELETLDTPFDPSQEIYLDYVVIDGRLWIRRIFDQATAPEQGLVIDPRLADLRWDSDGATVGKAAYRRLAEGRWIVTVTGDGSLGLARRGEAPVVLTPAPRIRDYAPVQVEVEAALRTLGAQELMVALVRRLSG